jgi:response regulator RpfG family c-di-GMP phosphodiesterase
LPPKPIPESIAEATLQTLDWTFPGLRKHSERVCLLSVETGRQLGLSKLALETLHLAARLHDIGVLINLRVLSILGQEMLTEMEIAPDPFSRTAMAIVAATRQSWLERNGFGLDRLSTIALSASIVSAAELYDNARKGLRPFPRVIPRDTLECAMLGLAGTCFDPRVVPLLLRVARKMRAYSWSDRNL